LQKRLPKNLNNVFYYITHTRFMKGTISAVRGIVVDLHFADKVPNIYDAVKVSQKNSLDEEVVIEVLQLLED